MTEMVTLPVKFVYKGKYVQPRCRLPNETWFQDEALVQIRRVSEESCPVAIDFDDAGIHGETVSMRWDGEALYRPMLSPDKRQIDLDTFIAMARGDFVHDKDAPWVDYPFPRNVGYWNNKSHYDNPFTTHTIEQAGGRFHETEKRADAEIQAIRNSLNVLVIGDLVHVKRMEPFWSLNMDKPATLTIQRGVIDKAKDTALKMYARLDRGDGMVDIAEAVGLELKAPVRGNHPDSVRIHMPEVLTFDDRKANADVVFDKVRRKIGGELEGLQNTDTVRTWADLMDLSIRYEAGDAGVIDEGYEVLARMSETGFASRGSSYRAVNASAINAHTMMHAITPALDGPAVQLIPGDDDSDALMSITF